MHGRFAIGLRAAGEMQEYDWLTGKDDITGVGKRPRPSKHIDGPAALHP